MNTELNNELLKHEKSKDISRRRLQKHLKEYTTANSLFLVLHLNHFLQQEKNEPHKIKKSLKRFFRNIDNEVFSKKSNKQLRRYVMIENLKKIGITHVQTAIEIPQHINSVGLIKVIKRHLNNQIVRLEHGAHVYDHDGLIDYNTKDIKNFETNVFVFDEVNSYKFA
jgi:hypothetical protein